MDIAFQHLYGVFCRSLWLWKIKFLIISLGGKGMPRTTIAITSKAEANVSCTQRCQKKTPPDCRHKPIRAAAFIGCILVIVALCGGAFGVYAGPDQGVTTANTIPPAPVPVDPQLTQATTGPSEVLVGAYLYFVRDIDTRANTFVGDFYLWFLWRGDRDPTKSFEIMNAVGAPTIKPIFTDDADVGKPEELPDGRLYQQFHIQGTFGCSMDFSTYPLDRHVLTIELEDTKSTVRDILYKVDEPSTTLHPDVKAQGWERHGFSGRALTVDYASTFGDPREQGTIQYAHVTFGLEIERPRPSAILEGLAPIVISMIIGLCALFLRPDEFGTRMAMYATIVMTYVFVNMDIASKVPDGAGTLLRKITVTGFIILAMLSLAGIRSFALAKQERFDEARRFDRICFGVALTAFFTACVTVIGLNY